MTRRRCVPSATRGTRGFVGARNGRSPVAAASHNGGNNAGNDERELRDVRHSAGCARGRARQRIAAEGSPGGGRAGRVPAVVRGAADVALLAHRRVPAHRDLRPGVAVDGALREVHAGDDVEGAEDAVQARPRGHLDGVEAGAVEVLHLRGHDQGSLRRLDLLLHRLVAPLDALHAPLPGAEAPRHLCDPLHSLRRQLRRLGGPDGAGGQLAARDEGQHVAAAELEEADVREAQQGRVEDVLLVVQVEAEARLRADGHPQEGLGV
mmetsp:Transcript_59728/g.167377  ORF Transcript_59728/g.167377 Transcript_59728/m.167377 type:complete len:265 (-) Transcript_59728:661-1455(-)